MFYPQLLTTITAMVKEYKTIPTARRQALQPLATYIQKQLRKGKSTQLIFICTHNSRRSHISHIWAQTAAAYYGIPEVHAYSGGTEVTAFNPSAVAALRRVGFDISQATNAKNPIYYVRFQEKATVIAAFSKVYSDVSNPKHDFCAVMTCSQADGTCPTVLGAAARVAVPYEDPKVADDTPGEAEKYDECTRQIGREMFYVFSLVNYKNKPEQC